MRAWLVWIAVAVAVPALLVGWLLRPGSLDSAYLVPIAVSFLAVGALLALKRPDNPIGWLFLGFGLVAALLIFADSYFVREAIVTPGSLPAARIAGWIGSVLWPSGFLFLSLLLLLFPDGRLPSPRWRPVAVALAISWSLVILSNAFTPRTTTQQGVRFTNPIWGSRRSVIPAGRRWARAQW
jgi:hypothetical protein